MTKSKNPYAYLSGADSGTRPPLTAGRRIIWILPVVFFTLSVLGGATTGRGSSIRLGLPQFINMDFPNGFVGPVGVEVGWSYLLLAMAVSSAVSIFVGHAFRESINRMLSSGRWTASLAILCVLGGFMDQLFPSYDMTVWIVPWLAATLTVAALSSAILGSYRDALVVSVFTTAAATSCKSLSYMLQGVMVSVGFAETLQLAVFAMISFVCSSIFVFSRRRFFQSSPP
jgi:hypothetical protein